MKTRLFIATLLLLCSASALAGDDSIQGEGSSGTDRSNRHAPVLCRTGETAVPMQGPDGKLVWTCTSTSASSGAERART
ncbi:MAG: hypothetical protein ACREP7_02035 [Lysobacter sp.]